MPSPDDVYRARVMQYEAVADAEDERSRWHSRARLLVAAMAVAALIVLVRSPLAVQRCGTGLQRRRVRVARGAARPHRAAPRRGPRDGDPQRARARSPGAVVARPARAVAARGARRSPLRRRPRRLRSRLAGAGARTRAHTHGQAHARASGCSTAVPRRWRRFTTARPRYANWCRRSTSGSSCRRLRVCCRTRRAAAATTNCRRPCTGPRRRTGSTGVDGSRSWRWCSASPPWRVPSARSPAW